MKTIQLIAAVAILGCGRHTAVSQVESVVPPGNVIATGQLRLLGTDPGSVVSARPRIKSVEARGGGFLLSKAVVTPRLELAETDQAWTLTDFGIPAGVTEVQFHVAFDGGSYDLQAESGDLDTTCADIQVTGQVARILERGHAVIQLDISGSLAPDSGGMKLVPQVMLQY
jgi:hypothetical protein